MNCLRGGWSERWPVSERGCILWIWGKRPTELVKVTAFMLWAFPGLYWPRALPSSRLTLVFGRCGRCALLDAAGTWVRCSAQALARGEGSIGGLCLSRSRVSSAAAAPPRPSVLSLLIMFNRSAKVPPFPNPSVPWAATFLPSRRHCTVCMQVESGWSPVFFSWHQCAFYISDSLSLLLDLKPLLT